MSLSSHELHGGSSDSVWEVTLETVIQAVSLTLPFTDSCLGLRHRPHLGSRWPPPCRVARF